MPPALDPFRLLLISLAGWLNQRQQEVIDYLQEETGSCVNNWETSGCALTTISADNWRSKPRNEAGACFMI